MNKIRIISNGFGANTVEFIRPDGTKLHNVTACDIELRPGVANKAKICFCLDRFDIDAEPLLSLDTVRDAAKLYGYYLMQIEQDK